MKTDNLILFGKPINKIKKEIDSIKMFVNKNTSKKPVLILPKHLINKASNQQSSVTTTRLRLNNVKKINNLFISACFFNNIEIIDYILKKYENLISIKNKQESFFIAVNIESTELLEYLIKKLNFNINFQDNYGMTLLMYALIGQQNEILKLLSNYNPDINIKNKKNETIMNIMSDEEKLYNLNKNTSNGGLLDERFKNFRNAKKIISSLKQKQILSKKIKKNVVSKKIAVKIKEKVRFL